MVKFMKKIPGGMLLIPMLVSAIFYTFAPNLFYIGGMTQALFTTEGINYIIAFTVFCSGASINIKTLSKVLKKQGLLAIIKTLIVILVGVIFFKFFGLNGAFGISTLALIVALASVNPSLYLALVGDYGEELDKAAFGIMGVLCTPAYPMILFSLVQATPIDWTPIISTLVPLIIGLILGNLDKDFADFLKPGLAISLPFMGWAFGAGINIVSALSAGLSGIVLTLIFYIAMIPIMYLFEKFVLKTDGSSTIAMASVAGMSVSVPTILAKVNPNLEIYREGATAAIAFAVVLTSIITPILMKKLHSEKN